MKGTTNRFRHLAAICVAFVYAFSSFTHGVSAQQIWGDVFYNASNFTGSGTIVWTVQPADVISYSYYRYVDPAGYKTWTVAFYIENTSISGTGQALHIAIPNFGGGQWIARRYTLNPIVTLENGTRSVGFAQVSPGGSYIELYKIDLSNWATSTGTTSVAGEITFEIQ